MKKPIVPTPLTLNDQIHVIGLKSDLECAQTDLTAAQMNRDCRLLHLKKACLALLHSRGLDPQQWCINNDMSGFHLIPTPKEAKEVEPDQPQIANPALVDDKVETDANAA